MATYEIIGEFEDKTPNSIVVQNTPLPDDKKWVLIIILLILILGAMVVIHEYKINSSK